MNLPISKLTLRELTKSLFQFFGLTADQAVGFGENGELKNIDGLGATVTEAELSLSDNTTANASTTKHGFLKKLSNVASEVMNGQGNWVTIATILGYTPANAATLPIEVGVACSDESTVIAAGTAKVTFRVPRGMTLTAVRASLTVAASTGTFTVDINEGGVSILSTKLSIDATEKTSNTAAVPAVISDPALADDAEITIDVDDAGAGDAKGLKIYLIGTR